MKRSQFICCAVALFASAPARAEWVQIATSSSHSVWYMDPERMKVDGAKAQAWVRVDGSHDKTVKWSEAKQLLSFDCSKQTYKILSSITYDTYGKIVSSNSYPDYGYGIGYEPVIPDTMAEDVEKLACLAATSDQ